MSAEGRSVLLDVADLAPYPELVARLERAATDADAAVGVAGLVGSARAVYLHLLARNGGSPLLVVVRDEFRARELCEDLSALSAIAGPPRLRALRLPAPDGDPYQQLPPHPMTSMMRAHALAAADRAAVDVLVVPVVALAAAVPPRKRLRALRRTVAVGEEHDPDSLLRHLVQLGYRRVPAVDARGEMARRGGVLDLFPAGAARPVRLELDDLTVVSLRAFDVDTQRSAEPVERVEIGPAREWCEPAGGGPRGEPPPAAEPGVRSSVFDYLPQARLVVEEPLQVEAEIDHFYRELEQRHARRVDRNLPGPDAYQFRQDTVRQRLAASPLRLSELDTGGDETHVLRWNCRGNRSYRGAIHELAADLRRGVAAGGRFLLLTESTGSRERLQELLAEYELAAVRDGAAASAPGVYLAEGRLTSGFTAPGAVFGVFTEAEVFGQTIYRKAPRRRRAAAFSSTFRDLQVGDYVVHVDHGIGRYQGLERVTTGDRDQEFMVLSYLDGNRLYVPTDRLDLVQKYSGVSGHQVRVDRLGGTAWPKARKRAQRATREMAAELLDFYARRKAARGHAFPPDGEWQREFDAAFPFEETPDQRRAIAEIKADMERPQPMERLLCGDVGFGKTEVAMRAAFKAVDGGKQVAVLAPTTVLAFQHLNTFRERFRSFPIRVEMLSRMRSRAAQKDALIGIASGEVDVVVGTHRVLSKDVRFRNLGLLVVDEEQRFGVRHKERLKQLKANVDVLTLTATPIPRTLQMAMSGLLNMSLLETPPPNRLAVQTHVLPFRKSIVASAIDQELRRGGQVYLLHNRVESIDSMADLVRRLCPRARVAVTHGQMPEARLERSMVRFLANEFDVLVTTTIIENGLDMPRVNTLVVNRADRLGLAQLYQLRGRVGRSDQRAYAYLLVPSMTELNAVVRRRLRALMEFSELGSGFRIAALDLEMRGAGELLGARQHGHIAAVGFDLYCQMLERAVQEMTEGAEQVGFVAQVDLGVDVKLPAELVGEESERLALYRRIATAGEGDELTAIRNELEDRYGRLPPQAEHLFDAAQIRLLAERAGVARVEVRGGELRLRWPESAAGGLERWMDTVRRIPAARVSGDGTVTVALPSDPARRLASIRTQLARLAS